MTTIGDLVLIYREEQAVFFARVEDISADSKPGWYQVRLLILQVPVVEVVWILREAYIGGEGFTMDGVPIRIDKIADRLPTRPAQVKPDVAPKSNKKAGNAKVISLRDRKNP